MPLSMMPLWAVGLFPVQSEDDEERIALGMDGGGNLSIGQC